MDLGIEGKYAFVTGGSHGIGRRISLALAAEGCNVAICARDQERVNKVVEEIIAYKVNALGYSTDVLIKDDIEKTTKEIDKEWGGVDILVNNVGGGGRWGSEIIEDTAEDVWTDVYSKNAMAAVRFTKWAIPHMRKEKWGRVVAISSIFGKEGGGRPWFNMAKSSQISLMKTLAMTPYLARDGITFNAVAPGGIMIEGTGWDEEKNKDPLEFEKRLNEKYPLGRLGTVDEVADVVTFICSKRASLVNGSCILVDGGESRSF